MEQYISLISKILSTYWGNSFYQWLFYISLLGLFFSEKKSHNRHIFFWYPVCVLIVILNPFFIHIAGTIWGKESIPYFCRQFSLIPIFYSIAYAFTVLIKENNPKTKLYSILGICLCIFIFGTNYIYTHHTYSLKKSDNMYKISNDLIEICDYMNKIDDDPVVALSNDLAFQARQYDSSLHLLTGIRDDSRLSNECSSDAPNVEYIIKYSCENGGDFAIVKNTPAIKKLFLKRNYSPLLQTQSYLLYECNGYDGKKYEYNESDQISAISYYDATGNGRITDLGYARVSYLYDNFGRVIEEYYYDKNSVPFEGYAGQKKEYDSQGYISKITYTDKEGNPILYKTGYATISYTNDSQGRVLKEYYFDENGNPSDIKGYYGLEWTYDDSKYPTSLTYLDENGMPIAIDAEYTTSIYNYDKYLSDHILTEFYYDKAGNPTSRSSGAYGVEIYYNDSWKAQKYTYLNYDSTPIITKDNIAGYYQSFDAQNRISDIYYFGINEEPCENTSGVYHTYITYDENGNAIYSYYNLSGKPIE